jgi:hypothetical protein
MRRIVAAVLAAAITVAVASAAPAAPTVTLAFQPAGGGLKLLYACWIEDESGKDVQNLYVCNRAAGIGARLTGDALPLWTTQKRKENARVDGVSGPSVQGLLTVSRVLAAGPIRRFRVVFEIDRSLNANAWFGDRPAFIYQSDLIDLDSLKESYPLRLDGWMANATRGRYGQQPTAPIPGFSQYRLMTDLSFIAPTDDMVKSLVVRVTTAAK